MCLSVFMHGLLIWFTSVLIRQDSNGLMLICSSGLPPWEAPVMIAEKRKLVFSFYADLLLHTLYQEGRYLGDVL